jgi:hypothetical protein
MITYPVLSLVETQLDNAVQAHIVPEAQAYPTSGSTFIRVSGEHTSIQFTEDTVEFIITFSISCSIRTRDFLIQNKRKPYETLLNLQEQCFFLITQDQTLISQLYTIASQVSVIGRYESSMLNTRVQTVYPDFFNSDDYSSRREAGYVLMQAYKTPKIIIPFRCLAFPPPLTLEGV